MTGGTAVAAAAPPVPAAPARAPRLRVGLLIESDGPGGAERMVSHLAVALRDAGHAVVAFLPADGEGWLGAELSRRGIAVETFVVERPRSRALVRTLVAAFRRHRLQVVHAHEFTMAGYGAVAARLARAGHVITMHGSRYYGERLDRRLLLRVAVALSGATVAVSDALRGFMAHDLLVRRRDIAVVSNGVPERPEPRDTIRTELGLGPDDQLAVCVGNLYPVKGHTHLLDAVARLAGRFPRLHVAIAGRGDQEAPLREQAARLRLGDRLHLLGLRADVDRVLGAADVFVHPSLSEGLPLAVLEAMLAGRAIVASDVGQLREVLADGEAGVLVPPADAAALARALETVLDDAARTDALGTRARARARRHYSVAGMLEQYLPLYQRAALRAGALSSTAAPS